MGRAVAEALDFRNGPRSEYADKGEVFPAELPPVGEKTTAERALNSELKIGLDVPPGENAVLLFSLKAYVPAGLLRTVPAMPLLRNRNATGPEQLVPVLLSVDPLPLAAIREYY